MRAMQVTAYDQPLALRDLDRPAPKAGEVQVKIATCGLNFGDLLLIKGTYQQKPDLPFTLGMELAGTITGLGHGVQGFRIGQRVAAYTGLGGLAEYAAVPADIACRSRTR